MDLIERATIAQNLKSAVRTTSAFAALSYLEKQALEDFIEGLVDILNEPNAPVHYLHLETLAKEYKNAVSHQDL